MSGRLPRRAAARAKGHSLVELVVTLAVVGVAATAAAGAIVTQTRLARTLWADAEASGARRIAILVLAREVTTLVPREGDLRVDTDSIVLRAFRGAGIVCATAGASAHVRYRGLRAPDPAKDSLLVVGAIPAGRPTPLVSASPAPAPGCAPSNGEVVYEIAPSPASVPGQVVLAFESGSYHFQAAALRYRRGDGGRQPLTPDRFFDESTDFAWIRRPATAAAAAESIAVRLRTTVRPGGPRAPDPPTPFRIPLRNIAAPIDSLEGPA